LTGFNPETDFRFGVKNLKLRTSSNPTRQLINQSTCHLLPYLWLTIAGFMRFAIYIIRMKKFAAPLRLIFISLIDISARIFFTEAS